MNLPDTKLMFDCMAEVGKQELSVYRSDSDSPPADEMVWRIWTAMEAVRVAHQEKPNDGR